MNKKTLYINIGIIVFVTILLFIYIFFVDGIENLIQTVSKTNPNWLMTAVFMMVVYWAAESFSVHVLAKKLHPTQRLRSSVKSTMLGQLFNSITPFASGGQPMQVFYLDKRHMPVGTSSLCLFARFFVYQAVLTVFSIFAIFFRFKFYMANTSFFSYVVFVGFTVNFIVILALASVAFFSKFLKKLTKLLINFLAKIKILKNTEKHIKNSAEQIDIFYTNFRQLKSCIPSLLLMTVFTFLQLTAFFSIPYYICLSLGIYGLTFFDAIFASAFVLMVSSFVPLPGGAIGAESSFLLFFNVYFSGTDSLGSAMIIWRFITFYLPIIVGLFFVNRLYKTKYIEIPNKKRSNK